MWIIQARKVVKMWLVIIDSQDDPQIMKEWSILWGLEISKDCLIRNFDPEKRPRSPWSLSWFLILTELTTSLIWILDMSRTQSLLLSSESFREVGPFMFVIPVLTKCLEQMGCKKYLWINKLINLALFHLEWRWTYALWTECKSQRHGMRFPHWRCRITDTCKARLRG